MFIEIKTKSSEKIEYIDSSCLIKMEIVDMEQRNKFAAVKKYIPGVSHVLEAETTNNVIVNDRVSVNGFSADSFDSESVYIHSGTEDECLDRLENLQSSLNWLKAENSFDVIPHGSYINPSSVMRLNMYERFNSSLHRPNTHQIDCILNHRYIPTIQDFIPSIFATPIGRDLQAFLDDLIGDLNNNSSQKIMNYIEFMQEKLESTIKYKEVQLFTGDETQCETKLIEIRNFLDNIN